MSLQTTNYIIIKLLLFPAERIGIQSLTHSHKKSMGYSICIRFSEGSVDPQPRSE